MTFGMAEIFLGIAIAIYFYMIVDRICKCCELRQYNKAVLALNKIAFEKEK